MKYRFRFYALSVSLLVVLGLSCTSHQSPRAVAPGAGASAHAAGVASGVGGGGDAAQPAEHLDVAIRAQAMAAGGRPGAATNVGFAESPAVRDLPPAGAETDLGDMKDEGPENPQIRRVSPSAAGKTADPVIQSHAAVPDIPGPGLTFDGLNNTDNFNAFGGRVNPSDDNGDVGPNHYVQQINLLVRVFSKGGAALTPPFKLSSLFAPSADGARLRTPATRSCSTIRSPTAGCSHSSRSSP